MDNKAILTAFWNCGDDQIIQFALIRAHLNKKEEEVVKHILDDCLTQEECAELMGYSTRRIQDFWYNGMYKLLRIPWVNAYGAFLIHEKGVY